jgi:hypothetical protein
MFGNDFALGARRLPMQLSLYEFDELSLDDRLNLLWGVGVFLSRVQQVKHTYLLYAVYNYYVEVIINHQGSATVSQAVAFDGGNRLNKHVQAVPLTDLGL